MRIFEKSATDQQRPLVYPAHIVERRHDGTWNVPEQPLFAQRSMSKEEGVGKVEHLGEKCGGRSIHELTDILHV